MQNLAMKPKLALDLWSYCFILLSSEIIDSHHASVMEALIMKEESDFFSDVLLATG